MKREIAEYPYNDYYIYIVFHKGEGRKYANLIPIDKNSGLKRKTISYARYLMSVNEKRVLNKYEHVDHKDNNKMHDDITNLQILSLRENNIKAAKTKEKKMVVLRCPNCKTIFERSRGQTHLVKGGNFTGCSRKCSCTFGSIMHYRPDDPKVIKALEENVIKEYIKH